jgi:hypothetical protein
MLSGKLFRPIEARRRGVIDEWGVAFSLSKARGRRRDAKFEDAVAVMRAISGAETWLFDLLERKSKDPGLLCLRHNPCRFDSDVAARLADSE